MSVLGFVGSEDAFVLHAIEACAASHKSCGKTGGCFQIAYNYLIFENVLCESVELLATVSSLHGS